MSKDKLKPTASWMAKHTSEALHKPSIQQISNFLKSSAGHADLLTERELLILNRCATDLEEILDWQNWEATK